jgi:hypothetical protein
VSVQALSVPAIVPARGVIVATAGLDDELAARALEACSRAAAVPLPWAGEAGTPPLPPGIAEEPLAVLAALAPGERQIPERLLRLLTRERPGASLLLLSRESLVRPTVTLQNGRVTLMEPPFSARRIASRLRLLLAHSGAEGDEGERTSVVGSGDVERPMTLHEHQRPAYWVGALGRAGGPDSTRSLCPPALLEENRGLTIFVRSSEETPPAQRLTDAAELVLGGGEPEALGARLHEVLGREAALVHLPAGGDEWLVYWPGVDGRLWLFSPQRLPPCWDLATAAAESAGACVRVPAGGGDVLMLLPDGSTDDVQGAARPGNAGAPPADLAEAAGDGGPALLEAIEARWRDRNEPAFALVVEAR